MPCARALCPVLYAVLCNVQCAISPNPKTPSVWALYRRQCIDDIVCGRLTARHSLRLCVVSSVPSVQDEQGLTMGPVRTGVPKDHLNCAWPEGQLTCAIIDHGVGGLAAPHWSLTLARTTHSDLLSTTLHHTTMRCAALRCWHCTTLHCTALHCPALHCTALLALYGRRSVVG